MTGAIIAFLDHLCNIGGEVDKDVLREAVELMTWLLLEAEVTEHTGARRHERSDAQRARRSGCVDRPWQTRVGEVPLRIPRLRRDYHFPSFPEPRKGAEKALTYMSFPREHWTRIYSTNPLERLNR